MRLWSRNISIGKATFLYVVSVSKNCFLCSNSSILIIIIWIFKISLHAFVVTNFYIYRIENISFFFWRGRRRKEKSKSSPLTVLLESKPAINQLHFRSSVKFLFKILIFRSYLFERNSINRHKIENTTDSSSLVLNIHRSCDSSDRQRRSQRSPLKAACYSSPHQQRNFH